MLVAKSNIEGTKYNLLTTYNCDVDTFVDKRDIVVETKNGWLQRINELHPSYLPLQYILFFPYVDDATCMTFAIKV